MKRDLDLIRELLVQFEELPLNSFLNASKIELPGWGSDQIIYHCILMDEAGLIVGKDASHMQGKHILVVRLTAAGHDYLDAVRDNTVWNKVKKQAADQGLSISIDMAKALAMMTIRQMFGVN